MTPVKHPQQAMPGIGRMIKAALTDTGTLTSNQIAQEIGHDPRHVTEALASMQDSGDVRLHEGTGTYRLSQKGRAV